MTSACILDISCCTGRHAIELSKRGYMVTGIDLSENLLRRAREKANMEDPRADFLRHDAREFPAYTLAPSAATMP